MITKGKYKPFEWKENEKYVDIKNHLHSFEYKMTVVVGQRDLRKSSRLLDYFVEHSLVHIDWEDGICYGKFVWIRYDRDSIIKAKNGFFDTLTTNIRDKSDSLKGLLDGVVLETKGDSLIATKDKISVEIGRLVALTSFGKKSINFGHVDYIHNDEFIHIGRKLIADELDAFTRLSKTIGKQNGECKLILSANSDDYNHSIFGYLRIINPKQGYYYFRENEQKNVLVLLYPKNNNLVNENKNTATSFLENLTGYSSIANDNEFNVDMRKVIKPIRNDLEPYYLIETGEESVYLYLHYYNNKYWLSDKKESIGGFDNCSMIALKLGHIKSPNSNYDIKDKEHIMNLYNRGRIYFSSKYIQTKFVDLLF